MPYQKRHPFLPLLYHGSPVLSTHPLHRFKIAHNKLLFPDHSAQASAIAAQKSISNHQPKQIESLSDSICVQLGAIHPPRTNPDFESLPDSKSPRPSAAATVCGHRPPSAAANVSGHRPPSAQKEPQQTTRQSKSSRCPTRFASNWVQSNLPEPTQILNRFPIQNRRD